MIDTTAEDRLKRFIDTQIAANPIEAKIVRRVVKALRDAGTPVVRVWDGGESIRVSTTRDVLDQVFNLDECRLHVAGGGYVYLVGGNEWDMISDYTLDLEDTLAPVNAWIESNWA